MKNLGIFLAGVGILIIVISTSRLHLKNEELKSENLELMQEVRRLNGWIESQEETIANRDEVIRILKFDRESIESFSELDKYY